MIFVVGCSFMQEEESKVSAGDMDLDLINFQAELMRVHPLLESGPLKDEVIEAFATLRQSIHTESQTDEVVWELKKILAKLGDEHTHVNYLGKQKAIALNFKYTNDGLVANNSVGKITKGDFILKIGEKPIPEIILGLREVTPKDHENTLIGGIIPRALHTELYLKHLGLLSKDKTVNIDYLNGDGETNTETLKLSNYEWKSPDPFEYTFDTETSTGIFVIRNFMNRSTFEKTWASFIETCKIEQPKNILIDLRESIGGYNEYYFADAIFSALGIKEYTTPYPDFYSHAFKKPEIVKVNKHLEPIRYENLYIATSPFTVSAPTIFAATVKENGLGTLIGQPVSNNLSFYASGGYNFEYMNVGAGIAGLHIKYKGSEPWINAPLQPDVYIPESAQDVRSGTDPILKWMASKDTAYKIGGRYRSYFGEIMEADWKKVEGQTHGFESAEDFLTEVDLYVSEIGPLTTDYDWRSVYMHNDTDLHSDLKIKFRFTNSNSRVSGGYQNYRYLDPSLSLNESLFEEDLAPIAHEITHIIIPNYSSLTFREGLACYLQDEIGKNPSIFNGGKDVHKLCKVYWSDESPNVDTDDVLKYIGTEGLPNGIDLSIDNLDTRRAYYLLNHSFSTYLIETYGLDLFMALYTSKDLDSDYSRLFDKELEALKMDWLTYLNNY